MYPWQESNPHLLLSCNSWPKWQESHRSDGGALTIRPHRPYRRRHAKGLRDRNSPTCTLSQNGYGDYLGDDALKEE